MYNLPPREKRAERIVLNRKYPSGVSVRIILFALFLIPVNCYWLVISRQDYQSQPIPTIISPFFNVIFILIIIILLNRMLIRFAPGVSLTQGELIALYIMLSLTSAIQSYQMMQTLVPTMEYPFSFATPENDWKNLFTRYIPSWLSVSDARVLQPYNKGESTLYIDKHIEGWLTPSLWWSAFVVILVLVMGYVAIFFRRPWVEHERLSYPIIQLPLEITNPRTSIFRNRLLWIGLCISGGMAVINGLASLHPILPRIPIHPTDHNLTQYVTSKPWNAIGRLPVGVIFSVVGLAFFMPLDMSFSCVFFFFLGKIQRFVLGALGTRQVAGTEYMVFLSQQAFGALMGIALVAIWVNRRHFIGLFRGSYTSNVDESLSYGKAGLGIVLGIGFMTLFLWKAGMAIWLSLVFFLLYYLISLGITRFRAEMGLPFHDFARGSNFTGPDQMLGDILGVRRLGYKNVTVMSMLFFFNFTYRGHPQPHQMEGFALLNRAGVSNKRVFLAMGVALIAGTLSLFWICLHVAYSFGANHGVQRFANITYGRLTNWISYPSSDIDFAGIQGIGVGLLVVVFLTAMRQQFLWWRLHPAAYAIANGADINIFWFSMLVGFFVKRMLISYGGIGRYRRARPLFLGFVLGEYIIGSLWVIIGDIIHQGIFFGGAS